MVFVIRLRVFYVRYELTTYSRVLLEDIIRPQIFKTFSAFKWNSKVY